LFDVVWWIWQQKPSWSSCNLLLLISFIYSAVYEISNGVISYVILHNALLVNVWIRNFFAWHFSIFSVINSGWKSLWLMYSFGRIFTVATQLICILTSCVFTSIMLSLSLDMLEIMSIYINRRWTLCISQLKVVITFAWKRSFYSKIEKSSFFIVSYYLSLSTVYSHSICVLLY